MNERDEETLLREPEDFGDALMLLVPLALAGLLLVVALALR